MEYEKEIKDLEEELIIFFEGLKEAGTSIFDTSRVWNVERDLEIEDNSFQQELFEYLQDKYDCIIDTSAVDMRSYVVIHDDWFLDMDGDSHKKEICKSGDPPCGLCKDYVDNKGECWYDTCKYCEEPRIEHSWTMGCRRTLDNFEVR